MTGRAIRCTLINRIIPTRTQHNQHKYLIASESAVYLKFETHTSTGCFVTKCQSLKQRQTQDLLSQKVLIFLKYKIKKLHQFKINCCKDVFRITFQRGLLRKYFYNVSIAYITLLITLKFYLQFRTLTTQTLIQTIIQQLV